jgi:acyl transferase domain-containing protein
MLGISNTCRKATRIPRRLLGSVKSNFGHLDTAAGIAGLIKAALAIRHSVVPPSLHFKRPNPEAGSAAQLFRVPSSAEPWPADSTARRAGISSFGIGGTNVHAILEEAPAPVPTAPAEPPFLLILSARAPAPLDQAALRLADHLDNDPGCNLADVAHTLAVGRASLRHRRFVVGGDARDAVRALRGPAPALDSGDAPPSVVFMFPGQGSQRPGMGSRLYAWAPVFREEVDRCAEILRSELPHLRDLLLLPNAGDIDQTALAQPALFTMEWALARQWFHWGVQPAFMIGHSLGELAAAAIAEVVSLPDALRLVASRGRLMQAAPPGAMLAVALSEAEVSPLLPAALSLAAVNGQRACVVAGPAACIEEFAAQIGKEGIAFTRLATSHAFHSAAMDEALAGLRAHFHSIKFTSPKIPFVSNLSGTWISAQQANRPGLLGASSASAGALLRRACDAAGRERCGAPGTRPRSGSFGPGPLASQAHAFRPGGERDVATGKWRRCVGMSRGARDAVGSRSCAALVCRPSRAAPARRAADLSVPASALLDRSAFRRTRNRAGHPSR